MKKPIVLPMDVRLMQWTSIGLFVLALVLCVTSSISWLLRHPVFSIQSITVRGNVTHSNPVMLRANVMPQLSGNFFTLNLLNRLNDQSLAIDFSYLDLKMMQILSYQPIWAWDYVTMSGLFYWWGSALIYFALMSL